MGVLENAGNWTVYLKRGDAVLQFVPIRYFCGSCEGAVLLEAERGEGGFGSTTPNVERTRPPSGESSTLSKRTKPSFTPGTPEGEDDDLTSLYEPISPPYLPPRPEDEDSSSDRRPGKSSDEPPRDGEVPA